MGGRMFMELVAGSPWCAQQSKRVSPTCLMHFERNRYSVPASFANRPVSLRIYPDRLVVAAEGQILCEHRADHRALARRCRAERSTTGGTIWRSSSASPARCAMARPSPNCPKRSGALQQHLLKQPGR